MFKNYVENISSLNELYDTLKNYPLICGLFLAMVII
jgi:hypothetical protein